MHLQSSAHNNTDKWKQSTSPSSLHKDNTVHTCNPQNRFWQTWTAKTPVQPHITCKFRNRRQTKQNCRKIIILLYSYYIPSVLWRCWLGGRKDIRPVKTEWWGAGMVVCLDRGADLHMAQLMPLPLTVSCFSKIQIGFTFLVSAHPGSPGKRAVKRVCVCVYIP